jgi:hypothetical protein
MPGAGRTVDTRARHPVPIAGNDGVDDRALVQVRCARATTSAVSRSKTSTAPEKHSTGPWCAAGAVATAVDVLLGVRL